MLKKWIKKIGDTLPRTKKTAKPESVPSPSAPSPAPSARTRGRAKPKLEQTKEGTGGTRQEWRPRKASSPSGEAAAAESTAVPKSRSGSSGRTSRDAPPETSSSAGDENPPRRRRRRRGGRGRKRPSEGASNGAEPGQKRASSPAPASPPDLPPKEAAAEPWDPASFVVPPLEGKTRFHDLDLPSPILRAIADAGFEYCTPIQAESLPPALSGRDIAGRAQTGTGKTAAFLIAIFHHFLKKPVVGQRPAATPRALVIAPTRELVVQIEKDALELSRHMPCHTLALFGGADFNRQLKKIQTLNPDLIVATPGRLLDFRSRHELHLGRVEVMVIDEADRMLDMGFIPDVRRIVYSTPPKGKRQTLLFSATLTDDVMRLASSWLSSPARIDIEPEQVAVDTVDQKVYMVTARKKFALLYNLLSRDRPERVLLFVNRRVTADRLTRALKEHGFECALISGALPQNQRSRTLEAFRDGSIPFLVATDVAGRGLHIEGVSHVINYNIPLDAEDYVHRIGRTGRAGASGTSITFACEEESFYIPAIEEYMGRELRCEHPPEEWVKIPDDVKRVEIPDEPDASDRPSDRRPRAGGGSRRVGSRPRKC